MSNIYADLTDVFNRGKLRAILSSGQAVVMHGMALASKDGDWIAREEAPSLDFILGVLESYGATYRLGAPLDARWMSGGWSAHFEFAWAGTRARTDFVTRPPRLSPDDLARMWREQESGPSSFPVPTLDLRRLATIKATQRERDYAFIGEIARRLPAPNEQLLWSRSARDLMQLALEHPDLARELAAQRPLLNVVAQGRDALEIALDAERRTLARADETRLNAYAHAALEWTRNWPALKREIAGLPLRAAHPIVVIQAQTLLPQAI